MTRGPNPGPAFIAASTSHPVLTQEVFVAVNHERTLIPRPSTFLGAVFRLNAGTPVQNRRVRAVAAGFAGEHVTYWVREFVPTGGPALWSALHEHCAMGAL